MSQDRQETDSDQTPLIVSTSSCYDTQPADCNELFLLLLIPGEYSSWCESSPAKHFGSQTDVQHLFIYVVLYFR